MRGTLVGSLTPPSGLLLRRSPASERHGRFGRAPEPHQQVSDRDDMDFEFSEDQELLRESVRRFVAERAPVAAFVRAQLDDPRGTTDDVWRGLAALGVTGLLVPEDHGGAGMGLVDMAVVLEELGRGLYPGPFASSAVGAASLVVLAGSPREHGFLLP